MSDFDWLDEPNGEVVCADCLEYMGTMPDGCIDAIVTDPPYGLSFMGAEWDTFGRKPSGLDSIEVRRKKAVDYAESHKGAPRYGNGHGSGVTKPHEARAFQDAMTPVFAEALRVCKPGAYLLCFGGTRTFHRMACAIEDAGWEIRDCVMWVYGSGFPKSMDVSKSLGKQGLDGSDWRGWGTCLKPAWEPIILARKPLDGTVAHNVLEHGTGALNIDACRVPTEDDVSNHSRSADSAVSKGIYGDSSAQETHRTAGQEIGRFPANLVHDGSQEVSELFPDTGKSSGGGNHGRGTEGKEQTGVYGKYSNAVKRDNVGLGDSGSAARFFYCAKASKKERGESNDHPTVKPLALMEWLMKLVSRDGAVVLDPFAGSGSTLVAARSLGRDFIGIERDPHYCQIILNRLGERGFEADYVRYAREDGGETELKQGTDMRKPNL